MSTELQVTHSDQSGIVAQIDAAEQALVQVDNDYDRLRIRDQAKALSAAAAILKRREIKERACRLVIKAEYAMHKANPAMPRDEVLAKAREAKGGESIPYDSQDKDGIISRHELNEIRRAYTHVDSEETLNNKLDEFKNNGVDPSRGAFVRDAAQVRRAERQAAAGAQDFVEVSKGGEFATVVIDPPWPKSRDDIETIDDASDSVTMTLDDIAHIDIPAAENAFIFIRANHRFLPHAFDVIKKQRLNYVFAITWVKGDGHQPPLLPKFNSEFIVVACKGSPIFLGDKGFSTTIVCSEQEGNDLPDEFFDIISRVSPHPRIDMFSRKDRGGFERWAEVTEG